MGATKLGLTEEELPPLVQMWRNASPHIVQFWWDIDRAAKECIKTHLPQTTHGMKFIYRSGCMFLRLRSGRNLCYPQPKIGTNRFGSESITFMGINTVKKWSRIETYGAKLVENIVKAASRDLLAEAMRRLEATSNSIVMHIHDEAVIDAPADRSLEKIVKIMTDDYNPRKDLQPGDLDYEKLKRSMKEFGYADPIIWNQQTGHVVGGHQRLKILQDEGIKEAECVVVNLGEEKEKALNIALNKISGDWDKDKLALLMTDLLAAEDDTHDDNFDVGSELNKPTFSKVGDLWHLGRHALLCGDATKKESYQKLLDDHQVNLVLTDPPYNVDYQGKAGKIKNDHQDDDKFYQFLLAAFQNMNTAMANDASIYILHADTEELNFRRAFQDAGFYLSGCCIWKK